MIQIILFPLSFIFNLVTGIRNFCFDIGIFKTYRSSLPVISVGNLTVGGTGKTPLILFLAEQLTAEGKKPVILSRGYKGKLKGPAVVVTEISSEHQNGPAQASMLYGDEPVLMALRKICPVVISRKRVNGVQFIESEKLGDIVLLDDGFQHRWLSRDIDIVCIDCSCEASIAEFQRGRLLPLGKFREDKIKGLHRATKVCLSFRRELAPESVEGLYRDALESLSLGDRFNKNSFASYFSAMKVKNSAGEILHPCQVVPLAGIAEPQGFLSSLKSLGFTFDGPKLLFPDHYMFTKEDLDSIDFYLKKNVPIVCTEKDHVRLPEEYTQKVFVLSGELSLYNFSLKT